MKDASKKDDIRVVTVEGMYHIAVNRVLLKPTWNTYGAASAAAGLLYAGKGTVTEDGNITWDIDNESK